MVPTFALVARRSVASDAIPTRLPASPSSVSHMLPSRTQVPSGNCIPAAADERARRLAPPLPNGFRRTPPSAACAKTYCDSPPPGSAAASNLPPPIPSLAEKDREVGPRRSGRTARPPLIFDPGETRGGREDVAAGLTSTTQRKERKRRKVGDGGGAVIVPKIAATPSNAPPSLFLQRVHQIRPEKGFYQKLLFTDIGLVRSRRSSGLTRTKFALQSQMSPFQTMPYQGTVPRPTGTIVPLRTDPIPVHHPRLCGSLQTTTDRPPSAPLVPNEGTRTPPACGRPPTPAVQGRGGGEIIPPVPTTPVPATPAPATPAAVYDAFRNDGGYADDDDADAAAQRKGVALGKTPYVLSPGMLRLGAAAAALERMGGGEDSDCLS
mmetsp:Transcript_13213/g.26369  ORF Transcript_13213/g.26369 Transcript_13213/m.26369 type:complete len:379 (+) Transcript_13213:412-1548(+)|eukprot:CAMPEP_0194334586 /NCGR_PEP_ID=MMETSP0171-20130528/66554_1 /TAXON_ID=218684 /ORGANISM="Corethron pennatum, Strain L29A3" /LENGTH=378 /DNA_ID=CAMNT_0039097287 /DNA_START=395 /DNA_END=1531 /DNA_ORIENTATION=+